MKRIFLGFNWKNLIVLVTFILVTLVLWNTYAFSRKLKDNERSKMEILAMAYDRFGNSDLEQDFTLEIKIIESNYDIPMIVTDEVGAVLMHRNLDSIKSLDSLYVSEQLVQMKEQNKPIKIDYLVNKKYLIYYKDSNLLVNLQYYPLTLLILFLVFSVVLYMVFRTNRNADQNKLYTGMAKETAHQLGTPLSSLIGWVELMNLQNVAPDIVVEIEKDVKRLNTIAERFSQIGSVPTLSSKNLIDVIDHTVVYFEARSSKNVKFKFVKQVEECVLQLNEELFTWVLENLIKNSLDAMSGKGSLDIVLFESEKSIHITVKDSGKGMSWKLFKKVFSPGFTTKKRGWGLGLSLSKRIVEDYHGGKIFVKKSEVDKGTTFEIQLPK